MSQDVLLPLKLALIPGSVLVASLVSRRFGHRVAGVVAGMPMIAGPIVLVLLIDQPLERVEAISRATLACTPALLAFMVAFARLTHQYAWPLCLAGASGVFLGLGWLFAAWDATLLAQQAIGLVSPALAMRLMPAAQPQSGGVPVPRGDIALRMGCALTMGAIIVLGAPYLPPQVSGLLLAWPITGSVLPCFTLAVHGRDAAVSLLRGYVNGLMGFVVFFVLLAMALPVLPRPLAFVASVAGAGTAAWLSYRLRNRLL